MNRGLVDEWRSYVAAHKLRVALLAGFVATHIATNLGMWFHGLWLPGMSAGLPDLNFNLLNGYLVFGNAANVGGTEGMQDQTILTFFGMLVHYAQGVAFALIFAFGVFPLIPIRSTLIGNVIKAVLWGFVLATLSAVWWINLFPNLAGPDTPAGIFFSNFGPNQVPFIVAVYLWHFIWGLNLGIFYNPAPTEAGAAVEATAA